MKRIAAWILYATIPVAIYLKFSHGSVVWLFIISCCAVLPIAAWIGNSTEHLAVRMGPTYGALFNATFGNFAEFIIAFFAIRAGLISVVRASLTGSVVGNLLFVAGQIGVDSAKSGIAGETTSAMSKIGQLLQRAGSGLDHVAKCTVFLADMKDWAAMNEAYIKFFPPDKRPARSSFGTTGIAQGGRVEIECIATTE